MLPDGDLTLERVDEIRGRGEGIGPMRRRSGHDHRDITDLQLTDTMLSGDGDHIMGSSHPLADLREPFGGTGMCLIGESTHLLGAPIVIADGSAEHDFGAGRVIGHEPAEGLRIHRFIGETTGAHSV